MEEADHGNRRKPAGALKGILRVIGRGSLGYSYSVSSIPFFQE